MTESRSEKDLTGYTELVHEAGDAQRIGWPIATLLTAIGLFATIAIVNGYQEDEQSYLYPYLFLVGGLLILVCLTELSKAVPKCAACDGRLISYDDADRAGEVMLHSFEVCERCKTYRRHSYLNLT